MPRSMSRSILIFIGHSLNCILGDDPLVQSRVVVMEGRRAGWELLGLEGQGMGSRGGGGGLEVGGW